MKKTPWCAACLMPIIAAFAAYTANAVAQSYPSRPIRLIVPMAPGGGLDIMARLVAQKLTESLGQAVVVDNRGGAGGVVGAGLAARATPDGYTLVMGNVSSHAVSQSLNPKLPYDTIKDFAPISLIASAPHLFLTSTGIPAKTIRGFVQFAKTSPEKFNYGSSGTGSLTHLEMELLMLATGTKLVHIPYKGVGPSLTALVASEVQLLFGSPMASLAHVRAGRIRALASTGEKRSQLLPEIPTLLEDGVRGFETGTWWGLLAPAGTPPRIVTQLHRVIVKIVQMSDVREKLTSEGAEAVGSTPAEYAQTIREEIAKWTKVVNAIGLAAK